MGACSAASGVADKPDTAAPQQAIQAPAAATGAKALRKAFAYKTNRPCLDNVAISLTPDGKAVQSFPAPTDVSAASAPLQLPDGWLLDRRGIGPNTAFISMTYAEYAALKQAPSTAELLKMVLPGVHITEGRRLPMSTQAAEADTAAVMRILNDK